MRNNVTNDRLITTNKNVVVDLPSITEFQAEPVFLNVYGAQESISRNEFRQLMQPYNPIPTWFLAPIDCFKIPALDCQFIAPLILYLF